MGRISSETIDAVNKRSDIVSVVGEYTRLEKRGSDWWGCCPFHNEKSPSFHVIPERGMFHCFGCGKGGDVFRFVMETENLDFPEAVRALASRCGVVVPEETSGSPEERKQAKAKSDYRERLLTILDDFANFFQFNLNRNPDSAVAQYLATRQLDAETVKKFRIGAAPDGWDIGLQFGLKRGYTEQEMLDAGVIIYNEERKSLYDRFRNRLVFSIWNEQGKVVGFSARTIDKSAPGAKYVNSPETLVFKKSHILYALPLARAAIGEFKQVILCEGQLDVIAMHRGGYACSVAPQGTAFTEEQAKMLRRYTDKVLLSFDADSAGQKAILRAMEILFNLEFEVRVLVMPAGEDPDGIFKARGADGIRQMVENSIDILDFLVKTLRPQFDMDSPYGRSRFLGAVLEYLNKMPNPVVKENYLHRLSELLQLKIELIYTELNKLRQRDVYRNSFAAKKQAAAEVEAEINTVSTMDSVQRHAENSLLELALYSTSYARKIADAVTPDMLSGSSVSKALNLVIALVLNDEYDSAVAELNKLDREQGDANLSLILTAESKIPPDKTDKALADCIGVLQQKKQTEERSVLLEQMKSAANDEDRMALFKRLTGL